MDSALSPRDIQARIRSGASVKEVADEAGVAVEKIEGFALPVVAEREHVARLAMAATVRRKGDGTHRRLSDIIADRLRERGMDIDEVMWDAWRLPDLRWRIVGHIEDGAALREAEFTFDPKGRFSVAHNADARWMIGEELPAPQSPDDENTIDFNDELALVRATQSAPPEPPVDSLPGDDVPQQDALYDDPPQTSELDELYDMLSGVSEDSVRIYVGLEDDEFVTPGTADHRPAADAVPSDDDDLDDKDLDDADLGAQDEVPGDNVQQDNSAETEPDDAAGTEPDDAAETEPVESSHAHLADREAEDVPEAGAEDVVHPVVEDESVAAVANDQPADSQSTTGTGDAEQVPLIEVEGEPEPAPKAKSRRRRAQVPSWDEIMFGGPTK